MRIKGFSFYSLVIVVAFVLGLFTSFAVSAARAPYANQRITIPKPSIGIQRTVANGRQKADNLQRQLNKSRKFSRVGVIVYGNTAVIE